jgi:hypothetical protein
MKEKINSDIKSYLIRSDGAGILTGPGDQINTDPMLGPLQDNGGPTFTHALLPGSPAIDAGDPSFAPPPSFDQRGPGFDRVSGSRIDIGSFEVQVGGTPTPTSTPTATVQLPLHQHQRLGPRRRRDQRLRQGRQGLARHHRRDHRVLAG